MGGENQNCRATVKFTFLGTGTSQGVPVIACSCEVCRSADPRDKRLRSAGLLEQEGRRLVIDTGPDFRQQMLRENVQRLDAILFTHEHKDHVAGLDDVRAFNYAQQEDMPVYADARTLARLQVEFAYAFEMPDYPGVPKLRLNDIAEAPFEAARIKVTPIPVWHGNLPVLGFRFGTFAYLTDAKYIPDASVEKLKGVEVLVLNALRIKPHHSHFTLAEAIEAARNIGAKTTFFTHISHLLGSHEAVSKQLPEGFFLGYDGLSISIPG